MTAPVASAVAKLVPSTVAVPESPDGAVKPSPGAAIVVAEAPPIAVPSRWALRQEIAREVGRGHADRAGDDRGESLALHPGEAVAGRGDHGDVHAP